MTGKAKTNSCGNFKRDKSPTGFSAGLDWSIFDEPGSKETLPGGEKSENVLAISIVFTTGQCTLYSG